MTDQQALPTLPKGWRFEADVDASYLTVKILNDSDFELASRSVPCIDPGKWRTYIVELAEAMWADMNSAARLSADLGLLVIYK